MSRTREEEVSDSRPFRPMRVGIVGDDVAGCLTALALKEWRPELAVTLIPGASPEPWSATALSCTPTLLAFLLGYLSLDPVALVRRLRPTLSLGTRFEWGETPTAGFNHAFGGGDVVDAQVHDHDLSRYSVTSQLMSADRVPIADVSGRRISLLKETPFSWHLERRAFVAYLRERAAAVGVTHGRAALSDVDVREGFVHRALTADGVVHQYDLWIDCSGTAATLIGEALAVPFESFEASLPTDAVVLAERPNDGNPKPYTLVTTLDSGWAFTVGLRDADHLGYVYSSRFLSPEAALEQLLGRFPGARQVARQAVDRFTPGRRAEIARGNVFAIGDAYGRIEPLASSGVQMIILSILRLVDVLANGGRDVHRAGAQIAWQWERLRWYLALHYRFNRRVDSPFWREVHMTLDWSGIEATMRDYLARGALSTRAAAHVGEAVEPEHARTPTGALDVVTARDIDIVLMAEGILPEVALAAATSPTEWHELMAMREALVSRTLPPRDAWSDLEDPATWAAIVYDERSWCHQLATEMQRFGPTRGRSQAALLALTRELGVPALSRAEALAMPDTFPASPNIDFGKFIKRVPEVVMRPKDQSQLGECLQLCVRRRMPIKIRGAGHSSGGQTLGDEGAVIDLRWLKRIIAADEQRIRVESGLWWIELVGHLLPEGRRPPVLIDNWRASVGGTLAVGGFGDASHREGLQLAGVRELVVMTLDGTRQRVRPGDELFDWSLGGRGQLGVITEVVLETVRQSHQLEARVLAWPSLEPYLEDMATVVGERRFDWLRARVTWARGLPVAAAAGHLGADAVREHDFSGLRAGIGSREGVDVYARSIEPPGERWQAASPGIEVVLPVDARGIGALHRIAQRVVDSGLAPYLPNGSSIMVLAGRTAGSLPLAPLPEHDLVMMVAIRPELPSAMVERFLPMLRGIADLALEHGGKIYLMSIEPTLPDWLAIQLGRERHQRLLALKRKWDPDGLLNPGLV